MTYKRHDLAFKLKLRKRALELGIYPPRRIGQMAIYIGQMWPRIGWKIWRLYR